MWGWIKELVTALLEFIEKTVSKDTYAKDADPNAGGMRSRFFDRVRNFRDSCARRNPSATGGTCKGSCIHYPEGRNEDQVGKPS